MEKCQHPDCQKQAENLCSVHSAVLCESHALIHVKSEDSHSLQDLYTPIPASTHTSLINFLFKSLQDINNIEQDLDRKAKVLINRILLDLDIVKKSISQIRNKVFSKLQQYSYFKKVSKVSKDPIDLLALKDDKAFLVSLADFSLPKVDFSFPEAKIFSLTNEEVFYQGENSRIPTIVAQLKAVKNKFMLFEFAKKISDKESQESLLKIIQSSANNPELASVASKAFTMLSKQHFNFSGLSLNKLNLSNAEVTGGKFIGTNFAGCNFSQVKLNTSVLRPALIDFYVYKSIEEGKKKFKGHLAAVTVSKFTSDGKMLVTGSDDNSIIVWDVASGHSLNYLEGHVDTVMCLDIPYDKIEIVSGGKDGVVKLWDLTTGSCFMNYVLETGKSLGLVFSVNMTSNKAYIIAGTWNEQVIIWHKNGQVLSLFDFGSAVWVVVTHINPLDDRQFKVAVGCRNGDLTLLKTGSDKVLWKQKEAHKQWISSVLISKNSSFIISSGSDGFIRIWKMFKTGLNKFFKQENYVLQKELRTSESPIFGLRTFSNFKFLIMLNQDSLTILDRKKLSQISNFKFDFQANNFDITNFGTHVCIGKGKSIRVNLFNELFSIKINN